MNDFIAKFSDIFENTDVSKFTPETLLSDIDEWDSLTALSLIAMAQQEYKVKISGDDIRKVTTIRDLFEKISELSK
ncbi:MAG: acyl carrier protein [Ignavibacteriales bacterium]|nr:acyl carrier protein [Ignavibacteriales bacterium]